MQIDRKARHVLVLVNTEVRSNLRFKYVKKYLDHFVCYGEHHIG